MDNTEKTADVSGVKKPYSRSNLALKIIVAVLFALSIVVMILVKFELDAMTREAAETEGPNYGAPLFAIVLIFGAAAFCLATSAVSFVGVIMSAILAKKGVRMVGSIVYFLVFIALPLVVIPVWFNLWS